MSKTRFFLSNVLRYYNVRFVYGLLLLNHPFRDFEFLHVWFLLPPVKVKKIGIKQLQYQYLKPN